MGYRPAVALTAMLLMVLMLRAGMTTASTEEEKPVAEAEKPFDIVLLTLDTTRADAIGAYGNQSANTPNINRLVSRGVRFTGAVSPSPLTLPAHASLLTGLEPPEHGARDNGRTDIDSTIPTIATILSDTGYHTAAFVSSRVLDHRFGLARGFDLYDDHMVAEHLGEYGYAERNATAVTDAAIAWLEASTERRPYFLWVHYYDPHSPYQPPERWRGETNEENYAGEISFVDQEVGRLLAALPGSDNQRLVAVVGDHGESLGEHGERTHGVFLYGATLEVPLIIAGPGLPHDHTITDVVSTRRLAPTLLALAGLTERMPNLGSPLPTSTETPSPASEPWVYSETLMPANAYGWSPLAALTGNGWRFIDAPRDELYDLETDPKELKNLATAKPEEAERHRADLLEYHARLQTGKTSPAEVDEDLVSALEALGYVTEGSTTTNDGIDPKDGLLILSDLEKAKDFIRQGATTEALTALQSLHRRNPSNVPILSHLASAQLDTGNKQEAIATYRQALVLNPDSEFLRLKLSRALARIGRIEEAKQEARKALETDPRSASAWLHLADLTDNQKEESRVLHEALEADTNSALVLMHLAELEGKQGQRDEADGFLEEACRLAPENPDIWLEWARIAELQGQPREAANRYQHALEIEPNNPSALLRLGIVHLRLDEPEKAQEALERATKVGSHTEAGMRAQALLGDLEAGGD